MVKDLIFTWEFLFHSINFRSEFIKLGVCLSQWLRIKPSFTNETSFKPVLVQHFLEIFPIYRHDLPTLLVLFNKLIYFLLKGVYHLLSFSVHLFSKLWQHRMICLSWFDRPCKRLLRLSIFETRLSIFFLRPTVLDRVTNDWRSLIDFLSIWTLKSSHNANKWGVCCIICLFESCAFRLFTLCCQWVIISW